ncbi:MAG: DUF5678 domain-containing protein, partial [Dehalococcoidia bacterium]
STQWTSVIAPASEEVLAWFREAWRESGFWQENYQRLAKEYPDQHLAVRDGEVIAVGKDPWELVSNIRAAGFEPSDVWMRFIPAKPLRLLL